MFNIYQRLQDQKRGTLAGAIERTLSGQPDPVQADLRRSGQLVPAPPGPGDEEIPGQAGQPDYPASQRAYDPTAGRGNGLTDNRPETEFARLMYPYTHGKDDDHQTFRDVISGRIPPPGLNN